MMKSLVTGGAGFIGSHLCETLLADGGQVVAFDNLTTGRASNIEHLQNHPSFRFVAGSVLDEAALEPLVRQADRVFHLASAVGVRLIIDQPVSTIDTIVEGTRLTLKLAERWNKPVLLTSSSEVYGKGSRIPFSEDDDIVLGPTGKRRWLYACAKMLDEFLALAHWHESKLPVVCVRLFNTVGPRQTGQYGMVLPRFVQQAIKGEAITVYGDGKQSRCFCHVSDAVGAIVALMNCEAARGKVVNIGSDHEVSMFDLAKRVIALTGSPSSIQMVPYEEAYVEGFEDMRRRLPNLSLANQLIGYAPRQSLDDIIRATITYWRG